MMNGYGYGMGWFGGLGMLIVGGLVIFGIVLLVRWFSDESRRSTAPLVGRDTALETARERLAKGEISPEEFESIKRSLAQ